MQNVQVNQSVNAANFLLVGSRAGNPVATKEETENSVDFADVLQYTSNRHDSSDTVVATDSRNNTQVSSKDEAPKNNTSISDDKTVDIEKKDDLKKTNESSDTAVSDDVKMDAEEKTEITEAEATDSESLKSMEESDTVPMIEGLEDISEEDMAVIFETLGNLIADIMQQFDISLEELSVKLEEFGMELKDLMSQQGLKEFFLNMNNVEVSDLIVDENLNQELQTFLTEVSDEMVALETLIPDMEAFVSNKDVAQMLSELTISQDVELATQPIGNLKDEVVSVDEPEVIIHNDKPDEVNRISKNGDTTGLSNSLDSSESDNRQLGESSGNLTSQEPAVTESSTIKQNTFTNPILQAIQNAINNVEVAVVREQPVQQTDILRQVVEQVRVNMSQQQTSLELQLYPEHLGRIQINVVSKEGVMTASIVAETEAAKQAIEAGLLNLREAMDQQELKVDAIEVMVSTTGFENDGEQERSFDEKGSSNPRRKLDLSELGEDVSVEEEAEVEKMKASGSSVSYRA